MVGLLLHSLVSTLDHDHLFDADFCELKISWLKNKNLQSPKVVIYGEGETQLVITILCITFVFKSLKNC
jgi:hypothetical protein